MPQMTNELIGTKEAAGELGVIPRRVRALITAGRLKAMLVGGTYLIRRRDLEAVRVRKIGRPRKAKR